MSRLVVVCAVVALASCLGAAGSESTDARLARDAGSTMVAGGSAGGIATAGGSAPAGGFASSGGGTASTCGMRAAGGADYRPGTEFLTSVSMTGAFGGVAGAASRCAIAARGAGLPARVWVPWLSADATWPGDAFFTSNDDGPDAFVSPACGGDAFCSLRSDERGVVGSASSWSGFTTPCVVALNCSGWTSASVAARGMTDRGAAGCEERHRLLCRTFGGPWPVVAADAGVRTRTSFVTREQFSGALGGVAGADTRCQQVARDAGLTGDYRAFLGTSALAAPSRFANGGRWGSVGSTEITFLNDETLSTTPRRALSEDETGAHLGDDEPIWTGTEPWAISSGSDCAQWTSTNALGTHGATGHLDEAWVLRGTIACSQTAHLLCLEN